VLGNGAEPQIAPQHLHTVQQLRDFIQRRQLPALKKPTTVAEKTALDNLKQK